MKSTKTTVAGLLAGIGLLASVLSKLFAEGGPGFAGILDATYLTEIVAALGALGLGWFARDDDVTSEGTKAPKAS